MLLPCALSLVLVSGECMQEYSPLILAVLEGNLDKVKSVLAQASDQAELAKTMRHQVTPCNSSPHLLSIV